MLSMQESLFCIGTYVAEAAMAFSSGHQAPSPESLGGFRYRLLAVQAGITPAVTECWQVITGRN